MQLGVCLDWGDWQAPPDTYSPCHPPLPGLDHREGTKQFLPSRLQLLRTTEHRARPRVFPKGCTVPRAAAGRPLAQAAPGPQPRKGTLGALLGCADARQDGKAAPPTANSRDSQGFHFSYLRNPYYNAPPHF